MLVWIVPLLASGWSVGIGSICDWRGSSVEFKSVKPIVAAICLRTVAAYNRWFRRIEKGNIISALKGKKRNFRY
ncbi:hypothetical protein Pint_10219 [Pistacia integerrima]|uniref:Uncharacterized protein n=1 Tax=Pistacia integerrima TaxID=434235 RepID=A0ACC0XJ91_9ROSI|nr:hypothetical protein Pint_10219 [Pistacia integerrima]